VDIENGDLDFVEKTRDKSGAKKKKPSLNKIKAVFLFFLF